MKENDAADVIVVGAGAAGLMAAMAAANIRVEGQAARVLLLDGREKIGAKILVSGGSRCNVTNEFIHPSRFHTESDPLREMAFKGNGEKSIVGRVLRAFSVEQTHRFFENIGVELKLEETGKYFPVSDSSRTVLNALLQALQESGAQLKTGVRVQNIARENENWRVQTEAGIFRARVVIITTGGLALPKSGSDGAGYEWARGFGHTIIPTTPALSPLHSRKKTHAHLSGIAVPARLVFAARGSTLASYEGSFLFTHWGYSGPVALNVSRHIAREKSDARLSLRLLPEVKDGEEKQFWQEFVRRHAKQSPVNALCEHFPRRVAETIVQESLNPQRSSTAVGKLSNDEQAQIRDALLDAPLSIGEVAGYAKAEATAGGVSLAELEPATMMSKLQDGLSFAGEVCDVDGWLGGYNFQWAWSSGTVAGRAAARWVLRRNV